MPLRRRTVLLSLAVLLATTGLRADEEWKFDVVYLNNGARFKGMLVSKKDNEVRFTCVNRRPGSHTVVFTTTLKPAEIASMDLLADDEREVLARRLKGLDPTGKNETQRMANLVLKPATWGKDGKALRFESTHFVLESNCSEDVVRRAAVRLEEIYAAYARFLPPMVEAAEPTSILLAQSMADYQTLLRDGKKILNPAFYDVARNQIVCGSDLKALGEQLELARQEHQTLLQKIKDDETKLVEIYAPKPVPMHLSVVYANARQKIQLQSKQNDDLFQDASKQLFRTLYHEAFHAYLANFVYPPDVNDVPRWMNEGLAQIFESSFVESGELRVGHADLPRLKAAREALRPRALVPMKDLLRAGPKEFVVTHATDLQNSDRFYLTSWSVAFYLTFERRLLGTKAMDDYVRALKDGADPVKAFEKLTGQTVEAFEKDLYSYLAVLQPNGTAPKK